MNANTPLLTMRCKSRWLSVCLACMLTSCAAPTQHADAATRGSQNVCATKASLFNPAMLLSATGSMGGVGGTGIGNGGLAGTGVPRKDLMTARPGIGGTGIDNGGIGGTGIVGVVTGFASVCVNGVEVQYDASTPVQANGQISTARELAVGQLVALQAFSTGAGAPLMARNVAVIYAAVGPISRVNAESGRLELLGQTVRTHTATEVPGLKAGDWVRVSGYRLASGDIAAAHIEPLAPQTLAQITGPVGKLGGHSFTVQAANVQLGNTSMPHGVAQGSEVLVRGVWDGRNLLAQSLELEPTQATLGNVGHVVLEGYVHAFNGREMRLGNRIVILQSNVSISGSSALSVDQRVQLTGRVGTDQRITADRVDVRGDSSGNSDGRGGKSSSGSGSGKGNSGSGKGSDSSGSGSGGSSGGSGSSGSGGGGSSGGGGGSSGGGGSGK